VTASARALLRQAALGRVGERPLVAPRASALAGEIEGLTPAELLGNPTKLANLLAQLVRGASLDVAWVESGSNLACEVAGARLDWSAFPPRPCARAAVTSPEAAMAGGRAATVVDATRRLRAVLGDSAVVGVALPGPLDLAATCPGLDREEATEVLLVVVRSLCQAGVELVLLSETGPPADPAELVACLRPLAATARFFQALPLLAASWAGDEVLTAVEALLPCLELEEGFTPPERGPYGLAAPWPIPTVGVGRGCVLLTTSVELTGRVGARDLGQVTAGLRRLVWESGG
jgi:hypothetical protein